MKVGVMCRKFECREDIHYKTQTGTSCEKCNSKAFRLGIEPASSGLLDQCSTTELGKSGDDPSRLPHIPSPDQTTSKSTLFSKFRRQRINFPLALAMREIRGLHSLGKQKSPRRSWSVFNNITSNIL